MHSFLPAPFRRTIAIALPIVVAITGTFGFAYLATQQAHRQSANDPQIQMAEDAAYALALGTAPAEVVPNRLAPINIAQTLAPWVTVYTSSGTPLESNIFVDLNAPHLPQSVFDTTTWNPGKTWHAPTGLETRFTWQPNSGLREAVVLVQYQKADGTQGFVAAGRSLAEVEQRVSDLTSKAFIAWVVTLLATIAAAFLSLVFR